MWTPEYFVRIVELPPKIDGVTVPNDDGTFDIYINALLSEDRQVNRLEHEIRHICMDHFYEDMSVAVCEAEANGGARAPKEKKPEPRISDIFAEAPPGMMPVFSSLEAFKNYVYAMREQHQKDLSGQSRL